MQQIYRKRKGSKFSLAFLDLKAAFDTVPRVEIWNALARKNVPSKMIRVIKAIYERVEGVVRLDGKLSNAFLMERGVKQGDSLSPHLFTSFMDEVLKICKRRTERGILEYEASLLPSFTIRRRYSVTCRLGEETTGSSNRTDINPKTKMNGSK
jgi:hypothetical protein